jgi:hypothetical protein
VIEGMGEHFILCCGERISLHRRGGGEDPGKVDRPVRPVMQTVVELNPFGKWPGYGERIRWDRVQGAGI